ncbi:MAG: hypothetical protein QOJ40_2302 [Verrucomicrobiota bacterium]
MAGGVLTQGFGPGAVTMAMTGQNHRMGLPRKGAEGDKRKRENDGFLTEAREGKEVTNEKKGR